MLEHWEKIYGKFDDMNYKTHDLRGLPNVSTFYHGEIIKWAKDIRPVNVLLAGEENNVKIYFQKVFQIKEIYTTGLGDCDYVWNFDSQLTLRDKFDLIISQAIIEHLVNPYAHLSDLAHLLSRNGYLIIHTVLPGYPYHRHPIDTHRFFPDFFEEIAKPQRLNLKIIKKRIKKFHIFYTYQRL